MKIKLSLRALYQALKVQYNHSKVWESSSFGTGDFIPSMRRLLSIMEKEFEKEKLEEELNKKDDIRWEK